MKACSTFLWLCLVIVFVKLTCILWLATIYCLSEPGFWPRSVWADWFMYKQRHSIPANSLTVSDKSEKITNLDCWLLLWRDVNADCCCDVSGYKDFRFVMIPPTPKSWNLAKFETGTSLNSMFPLLICHALVAFTMSPVYIVITPTTAASRTAQSSPHTPAWPRTYLHVRLVKHWSLLEPQRAYFWPVPSTDCQADTYWSGNWNLVYEELFCHDLHINKFS